MVVDENGIQQVESGRNRYLISKACGEQMLHRAPVMI